MKRNQGSVANSTLNVKGTSVAVVSRDGDEYISLTDIARYKDAERTDHVLQNWLRNRNTIEFLGVWEQINNQGFKPLEFEGFRSQAGLNSFVLTARQWIDATAAIGLIAKQGRNGGTFAHKDPVNTVRSAGMLVGVHHWLCSSGPRASINT